MVIQRPSMPTSWIFAAFCSRLPSIACLQNPTNCLVGRPLVNGPAVSLQSCAFPIRDFQENHSDQLQRAPQAKDRTVQAVRRGAEWHLLAGRDIDPCNGPEPASWFGRTTVVAKLDAPPSASDAEGSIESRRWREPNCLRPQTQYRRRAPSFVVGADHPPAAGLPPAPKCL